MVPICFWLFFLFSDSEQAWLQRPPMMLSELINLQCAFCSAALHANRFGGIVESQIFRQMLAVIISYLFVGQCQQFSVIGIVRARCGQGGLTGFLVSG
jgi:hypothetical protein